MPGDRSEGQPVLWMVAGLALIGLAAGCFPQEKPGFDAVGPAQRLDAVVLAADRDDAASLRGLIQTLDSDDPAARLLAIRALEKRTGQTLGYRYTDPPWKRDAAVTRWLDWMQTQGTGQEPGMDEAVHGGGPAGEGP